MKYPSNNNKAMSVPVEFTEQSFETLPEGHVCLLVLEQECRVRPNTLVSINIDANKSAHAAFLTRRGTFLIHVMKHGFGHNPLPAHLDELPSYTLGTWFASVGIDIAEVYTHVFSHTTPKQEFPLKDDVQACLRRLENGKSFTKTIHGQDRTFIKFNDVMGVTYRAKSPQHVRMLFFDKSNMY